MTILLSNSSPKIPKSGIFDSKFRYFCVFVKFYNQTNSRVLISNMTILFSNSPVKIPKSNLFSPKCRHFCFFVKYYKQPNLRVLTSNKTIVFLQFLLKNTHIRHFWSKIPKSGYFCFFLKILQLRKFERADFKDDKIVFKFQSKIFKSGIFDPKLRHFCFFVKFCKQTNLRVLISNMTIIFL